MYDSRGRPVHSPSSQGKASRSTTCEGPWAPRGWKRGAGDRRGTRPAVFPLPAPAVFPCVAVQHFPPDPPAGNPHAVVSPGDGGEVDDDEEDVARGPPLPQDR